MKKKRPNVEGIFFPNCHNFIIDSYYIASDLSDVNHLISTSTKDFS
jgi:hypothetical protein